jgi:hypothetical protein
MPGQASPQAKADSRRSELSSARGCCHTSAHDRQGSWPVARRISKGAPVTGNEVGDTWFQRNRGGYASSEVDDLLRLVAAEQDLGQPVRPLIQNTTFRQNRYWQEGYDIDAVDWVFDQLLLHSGDTELGGIDAGPWRDLPVAQFARGRASDPAEQPRKMQRCFREECENAWRDFGQQPGTYLRWGPAKGPLWGPRRHELRTPEQRAIASRQSRGMSFPPTISTGGRSFTYREPGVPADSATSPSAAGIAALAARAVRDRAGHFAAEALSGQAQPEETSRVKALVDKAGTPILYTSGLNYERRAYACVTFPDGRWLRFLVRGTRRTNAIMTAVDQTGNKVARYRLLTKDSAEITVHPDQELTDELVLAITTNAPALNSYFDSSQ